MACRATGLRSKSARAERRRRRDGGGGWGRQTVLQTAWREGLPFVRRNRGATLDYCKPEGATTHHFLARVSAERARRDMPCPGRGRGLAYPATDWP